MLFHGKTGALMKKLVITLLMFVSFNAYAVEVETIAEGFGESYDWAVLNAVENAVRQTSDINIENNVGLQKIDTSASVTREKKSGEESSFSANLNAKTKGDFDIDGNSNYNQDFKYQNNESEQIRAEVKDNSKYIPAKYEGVVSSYEVLEHTENNGQHKIKIKAKIIKECRALPNCATQKADCSCYVCNNGYKLVDKECLPCENGELCGCTNGKKWSKDSQECIYDAHDYQSKDLIKKSRYSLAVLPFKTIKPLNCLGTKFCSNEANTLINNAFIEALVPTRKFNVVDRNNLDSYNNELALITADLTLPENKNRLKNIVPADYILVGSIDNFSASSSKQYVEITKETLYDSYSKLKISYRILETATMEIISSGSVEKSFSKEGRFSNCTNVFDLLIKRAATDATTQLLTDIFPDYQVKKELNTKSEGKTKSKPAPSVTYALPFD